MLLLINYLTTSKVLDRTAVILEIFAQHAQSREGQLQVELAMLEYRLTRGPRASGNVDSDKGCGFRGPGETKLGTKQNNHRSHLTEQLNSRTVVD